jgi:DNA-binding winged helix-turn-helix (wHTH) protein
MTAASNPRLFRFGVYEADLRTGELRKNGLKVRLQEQPFQVLAYLLEHAGDVVTREDLRARLWPADTFVDFDHSLNTAINKLRDALGDTAANPRFIETLAKRGYRLIAPVHAVDSIDVASATASTAKPSVLAGLPATAAEPATVAPAPAIEELDLPPVNRSVSRTLFTLVQVMYLIFYLVSMAKLVAVNHIASILLPRWDWLLLVMVVVSAVLGIPIRLYLLAAVLFDFRKLGEKFQRLFPFHLPLDLLWALSPFLLQHQIGFGLAFAATAALLYLPFSQRTLVRMMYPRA